MRAYARALYATSGDTSSARGDEHSAEIPPSSESRAVTSIAAAGSVSVVGGPSSIERRKKKSFAGKRAAG